MRLTCNVNVRTCDSSEISRHAGEWLLGLRNPNLVQNPFLFSQRNEIEK